MTEHLAPGTQDRTATWLGWAIFVAFVVMFANIVTLPRTPLDGRMALRVGHDSIGWIVGCLCWFRLYWFAKGPKPAPPSGLPIDSFAFNRAILFAIILVFAVEFLIGLGYAWGEGRDLYFFGFVLPQLLETTEPLRKSTGYPHSALAFYYLMLFSLWITLGAWQVRKYKTGWRRLFPGAQV
jgi:cytochrome b561